MSSVVVIADYDDPDVLELTSICDGAHLCWLRLGLSERHYTLRASSVDGAVISCDETSISDDEILSASAILFRRWKVSPPVPMIVADVAGDENRFAEREWTASLCYVLSRWYSMSNNGTWSRNPSFDANKLTLLDHADAVGFCVPSWVIDVEHSRPSDGVVSKAIGTDQAVRPGARVPTTLIELPRMAYLFSRRQPCPTLLQSYIACSAEIRLAFAYGAMAAVKQTRIELDDGGRMADIRYVPVRRSAVDIDDELRGLIAALAAKTAMNAFTADLLIDTSGTRWLVDINPDGLFIAADNDEGSLRQSLVTGLLSR